jgi:hypothetical protein
LCKCTKVKENKQYQDGNFKTSVQEPISFWQDSELSTGVGFAGGSMNRGWMNAESYLHTLTEDKNLHFILEN